MRPLQEKIIAYEHVLPEIDPQKEIRKSIDFLKDYLKENPFLKILIREILRLVKEWLCNMQLLVQIMAQL